MKNLLLIVLSVLMLWTGNQAFAQAEEEKLDLPGDNLNLYAVLKLFQESETLEGFERKLNEEDSEINNLDLDGDNQTDYIRVEDNVEGNLHTISLKVAVSESEDQDVAAFYVEKKDNGEIWIQLVGDEDLYGKDYIIEPNSQSGTVTETPNPGYSGNREVQPATVQQNVAYVSDWPVIQFIFVPRYVIWRSPWRWHYYPSYWRPWRPRYWHYYYGYHYHWHYYYNGHFRRWPSYRNPGWHTHYYGGNFRSRSVIVHTRYTRGDYRATYSRPSSAREGSALFVKRYPQAPTTRERLPSFDNTGRPVITRPSTGRPGTTRPGNGGTTRPGTTRPSDPNPGVSRPDIERPTRPGNPDVSRPTPRPRPEVTRPTPSPRPEVTRPAPTPRPETSRPSIERPTRQTPSARPVPAPRQETPRTSPAPSGRQQSSPRSSREAERP
ncbi:hypothetical protein J2Y45_004225 [Dyadobacter sp. BE34]|uniref:Uncharacterized protein n=1 Tax=Dyadobacter fermentans TaxID=94254 RepID=A0ABU1R3A0_9BACT|nr:MULTISPECIES: hypothetical protein [Dyadobacter]MDR6807440.1 hypothetical protein [Dyadobacter fermentans]MDR7045181.1 hypothetical protein [Dyadobacter sp. BE242]MDR7199082.1 hypothetical protein [Dyadobacter sp. BE34]MDR7217042.1 hypothetical protein [Dyadobacter sp. BE31]MDR7264975.1 hypothetical protein [Dyadobacter sp. BE32]